MRNRRNIGDEENTNPNSGAGSKYQQGKKENRNEEDGNGSQSDPEESIQAAHPNEDALRIQLGNGEKADDYKYPPKKILHSLRQHVWNPLQEGKVWWAQCVTIALAALLTYSFHNVSAGGSNGAGVSTNLQIAIMSVITLVGATPFCSTHLIPAAIGAFVGGHNIIGSNGDTIQENNTGVVPYTNYAWLMLLSAVVALVWCFVVNNPSLKILDGFAGRLGTTTFLGMNVVMVTIFGPVGVVDWNRYYYGFVHAIPVAEEDSSISLASAAWSWSEELELAIGYVLAVLWLGVVAGANRVLHQRYIQQWERNNKQEAAQSSAQSKSSPKPLNNVLVPVLWALLSMLVINATQYKHAPGLYNGFAVGAYVAMASLQKIPSIVMFATVSLLAALWGLTLTPFFVGFAGKSGFTSMLGHVTHTVLERIIQRLRIRKQRQLQAEQHQQESKKQDSHDHPPPDSREDQEQDILERQPLQSSKDNNQHQPKKSTSTSSASAIEHYHHSRKYIKPKETLFTKQQRRQQQRLSHLRHQQQQQQPDQREQQSMDNPTPQLHHRAWSTLPEAGGETRQHWQHRLEHESPEEGGPPSPSPSAKNQHQNVGSSSTIV